VAGEYDGQPYTDSWDDFRSRNWDADTENLTVLLGLIGAGRLPPHEQQQVLREWTRTAPYVPCPPALKAKVETFLRTGKNPDAPRPPGTMP
jgi:hypothetical protein